MMKLGFASAILPDINFREVMQIASDIGYECVEVMCWPPSQAERRYSGVTHIDLTCVDSGLVNEVAQVVDQTGVSISALGYYPNCLSPDVAEAERAVSHLTTLIQSAPRFGLSQVNTFIGRDYTKSVDDNWSRMLETWKPLMELAEQHQVRIGIENCPMFFSKDEWPGGKNLAVSPSIWKRLFEDLGSSRIGLNYDPSHMVWQQMNYLKPLQDFASRLFHIHAKDVRVDHDQLDSVGILAHPSLYHTPKLPGMGDIDWGQFFSLLTDVGYRGAVCVEVEDRAFESSRHDRILSLKQSYTFLRNFIPDGR